MRVTAETKTETRRRILAAAQQQLVERGYDATTTRDIAQAAGIATGTLFNYFPTKESVVQCLVNSANDEARQVFEARYLASAPDSAPDGARGLQAGRATLKSDDGLGGPSYGAAENHAGGLLSPARERAAQHSAALDEEPTTLTEDLFAFVASGLRKLKPLRKSIAPLLETTLSPLSQAAGDDAVSLRTDHLETVRRIADRHGLAQSLTPVALQLYWTLYTGVLAFWVTDNSRKQEATLALLDESLQMYVGWLPGQRESGSESAKRSAGISSPDKS